MGQSLTSVNPATGQAIDEVEVADEAAVHDAVQRADAAQRVWAAHAPEERLDVLKTFSELLMGQRESVASLITQEAGKPLAEARVADIMPALEMVSYLDRHGADVLAGERFRLDNALLMDRTSEIHREPLGVVGIIAPWNYPFSIPATQVVSALYAGNGVVLKPSEKTPLVGRRLVELLWEAGVPPDLVQLVQGPGDPTGKALAEAAIDMLVFTGSVPTGKAVATEVASRLTPHVLELGGKDPMLVLEDANVELAARGAVWGAFTNAGQTCSSVERVYVHDDIADTFLEHVVETTEAIQVGPGDQEGVDLGPLIDDAQLARVEEHIEDATAKGAKVVTGGQRLKDIGDRFYAPTVLTDVDHDMAVMVDETFGPVLPVMPVTDDKEAVELANATEYGLTASIWTADTRRAEAIAHQLEAGTVTINDCVYTYAACETPWGGIKASGLGHTHGRSGLEAMTRPKHINKARSGRSRSPWYYPYDEDLERLTDEGMEFLYGSKLKGLKAAGATLRRLRGPKED